VFLVCGKILGTRLVGCTNIFDQLVSWAVLDGHCSVEKGIGRL
jgi:hypothetical protein